MSFDGTWLQPAASTQSPAQVCAVAHCAPIGARLMQTPVVPPDVDGWQTSSSRPQRVSVDAVEQLSPSPGSVMQVFPLPQKPGTRQSLGFPAGHEPPSGAAVGAGGGREGRAGPGATRACGAVVLIGTTCAGWAFPLEVADVS